MVKLNSDGASKEKNSANCGGVIIDDMGVWISGLSKYLGHCSAIIAGFWGVFEGLKLTKSSGLRIVEINVDSVLVVKVIEEGKIRKVECLTLIKVIQRLIKDHEIVRMVHAYRKVNLCANVSTNK